VDEAWRVLHLLAAAYWLGGLIMLAMLAIVARSTLDAQAFRSLMAAAGRAFLAGSAAAWAVIAISGVGLASSRMRGLADLGSTGWGRTLSLKTGMALLAILLTAIHSFAGSRTSSPAWLAASRALSPLILLVTIAIFYLAVRLTEG
jgi:putative copper export protein